MFFPVPVFSGRGNSWNSNSVREAQRLQSSRGTGQTTYYNEIDQYQREIRPATTNEMRANIDSFHSWMNCMLESFKGFYRFYSMRVLWQFQPGPCCFKTVSALSPRKCGHMPPARVRWCKESLLLFFCLCCQEHQVDSCLELETSVHDVNMFQVPGIGGGCACDVLKKVLILSKSAATHQPLISCQTLRIWPLSWKNAWPRRSNASQMWWAMWGTKTGGQMCFFNMCCFDATNWADHVWNMFAVIAHQYPAVVYCWKSWLAMNARQLSCGARSQVEFLEELGSKLMSLWRKRCLAVKPFCQNWASLSLQVSRALPVCQEHTATNGSKVGRLRFSSGIKTPTSNLQYCQIILTHQWSRLLTDYFFMKNMVFRCFQLRPHLTRPAPPFAAPRELVDSGSLSVMEVSRSVQISFGLSEQNAKNGVIEIFLRPK